MMVLVGLTDDQKRKEIVRYVNKHKTKKVVLFYSTKFPLQLPPLPCPVQMVDYDEIIMYRTFYPLLGEINKNYLLVINELLRNKNRNNLTFNCLRHYLNQCGGQIIFEYFPIIDNKDDFMALLDFDTNSKFKGSGFNWCLLHEANIQCVPHKLTLRVDKVDLPAEAEIAYEKEKNRLFDNIGNKDPDTIPRSLHIWCGKFKRSAILPDNQYIARNARFKMPNVTTFANVTAGAQYIMLDFPHRRLDMNDFLRRTSQQDVTFISTGLRVDQYYISEFNRWIERLEEFYAQASVYSGNG